MADYTIELEEFKISSTRHGLCKIEGGYRHTVDGKNVKTSVIMWTTEIHRAKGLQIHASEYRKHVQAYGGDLNEKYVAVFREWDDAEKFIKDFLEPRALMKQMSKA